MQMQKSNKDEKLTLRRLK